jgi:hypothetical protein
MPVIPATGEAEIRRIIVLRSVQAKSYRDPLSNKAGMVVHNCNPSYATIGMRIVVQCWSKSARSYLKNN